MLVKSIRFCDFPVTFVCDEKCEKAWGISNRMRIMLSDNEDDYEYPTDNELGIAPVKPGTWEGEDTKPTTESEKGNKWCVRECERSKMFDGHMNDFSKRVKNFKTEEIKLDEQTNQGFRMEETGDEPNNKSEDSSSGTA